MENSSKKVLLSTRDITRTFKNGEIVTPVLKGVSLEVFEGEFLVILGESGCGKTTFLNILGGLDKPDSGSFSFMNRELAGASNKELTNYRREDVGYIFQSFNLMPNLTAKRNVELIAELVKKPMKSWEVLELVGLADKMNNYPSELSGGQQQRVSVARALVKRPKLILADEPTSALDYATSIEVLSVLENVVAKGTTIIMVTHNEEITKMAHRYIRFRDGVASDPIVNEKPCKASELVW